uniref:Uncharacterized protein n=1 Tax=Geospiza parvula TaxID=87175 RepID=A0A8U8B274_GEOPR
GPRCGPPSPLRIGAPGCPLRDAAVGWYRRAHAAFLGCASPDTSDRDSPELPEEPAERAGGGGRAAGRAAAGGRPGPGGREEEEERGEEPGEPEQRNAGRKKKTRTVFSRSQVFQLESTFDVKRYLSSSERAGLAASLHLTETQRFFGGQDGGDNTEPPKKRGRVLPAALPNYPVPVLPEGRCSASGRGDRVPLSVPSLVVVALP